jgi:hypothetical protein
VSVALFGPRQALVGGMLQVLGGAEQVLVVAVHVLVCLVPHVPVGKLQTSGVPMLHALAGGGPQVPPP